MVEPSHPFVARIRRGDEHAFARFYDLWFDRAVGAVRRLTRRDESFCLDVVQDAMLKVVHKLPRLRDEAAVEAWMARTLFSTATDRLRADRRRRRREQGAARARPEEAVGSVDAALARDEELAWVRARLDELPEEQREMILHRFEDRGTLQKAGEAHGLSPFAVHGRIRRILGRWRAQAQGD